jgi:hypothetical protein
MTPAIDDFDRAVDSLLRDPPARAAALSTEIGALIDAGRVADCLRVLAEGRRATLTRRAPRGTGGALLYEEAADHATRIAAARIELAYKYGNPVSASEIRMLRAPTDEPNQLSPEEQMRELRATGLDLEGIVRTWVEGLEKVSPVLAIEAGGKEVSR